MATMPTIKATTGLYTSVGLLNAIINDDENTLLNGLGEVQATTESIRAVGDAITSYAPRRNQFISALVNRIGMVRFNYMLFKNPWAWAKRGKLEMGETIEQIWIDLAKVYNYDPKESETRVLKREKPDVKAMYHSINCQSLYKITVSVQQLKAAFLSLNGLTDFIDNLIGSLARSASFDEFMLMKYLLAQLIIAGKITKIHIDPITKTTASDAVTAVGEITNAWQFPSEDYNIAHVVNTTPIDDLYILESASANALIKVNALASAFNIEEMKFMGHVVMFDDLSKYDDERMADILQGDSGYTPFTTAEKQVLSQVQMIAMDRNFMQIYDSFEEMGEPFINGDGLYTNYNYHKWMVYSASPFHNVVAFTTETLTAGAITSVTWQNRITIEAPTSPSGNELVLTGTQYGQAIANYTGNVSNIKFYLRDNYDGYYRLENGNYVLGAYDIHNAYVLVDGEYNKVSVPDDLILRIDPDTGILTWKDDRTISTLDTSPYVQGLGVVAIGQLPDGTIVTTDYANRADLLTGLINIDG